VTAFFKFFDNGGNWLLFLVAFCLIEAPGVFWGHRTMSATLWGWVRAPHGWLLVVAFQALALLLFVHFFSKG
jgi:hypothetical protein